MRALFRSAADRLFDRLGLVVLDQADYREAVTQAHKLWHYVVHSGHISNRFHCHGRIRSTARRIAARLGHPIWYDAAMESTLTKDGTPPPPPAPPQSQDPNVEIHEVGRMPQDAA